MTRDIIQSDHAPKAIGPYSQCIVTDQLVFTSGQIPIDPATGDLIAGGITEQTERVLKNLRALLESAGTRLENVVKTTVFLQDMNDFAAMNAVYATYFTAAHPCRSTIQVARLPKDSRVEIEAIALR